MTSDERERPVEGSTPAKAGAGVVRVAQLGLLASGYLVFAYAIVMSGYSRFYQTIGLRLANVPLTRDQVLLPIAYLTVIIIVSGAVMMLSVWSGFAIRSCLRRRKVPAPTLLVGLVAIGVVQFDIAVPFLHLSTAPLLLGMIAAGHLIAVARMPFQRRSAATGTSFTSAGTEAMQDLRATVGAVRSNIFVFWVASALVFAVLPLLLIQRWETHMEEKGEAAIEHGFTIADPYGVFAPEGLRPVTLEVVNDQYDPLGICNETDHFAASIIEPTGDQVWIFLRKINTQRDERFIIRLPEDAYVVWAEALRQPSDGPWDKDACRGRSFPPA